jgi:hypothetical protein
MRPSKEGVGRWEMTRVFESRILSVRIERGFDEAYDFLAVPENFPRWASGLGRSLEKAGGEWVAHGPEGPVRVRFTERNPYGVLDHYVMPEAGGKIYIPLRLISNGEGCEIIFTLFRAPGTGDEVFARDAEWVMRDLNALKSLLEG